MYSQGGTHRLWVLKPQKAKLIILEYQVEIEHKSPLATLFTRPSESIYKKNNVSECDVTLELYRSLEYHSWEPKKLKLNLLQIK